MSCTPDDGGTPLPVAAIGASSVAAQRRGRAGAVVRGVAVAAQRVGHAGTRSALAKVTLTAGATSKAASEACSTADSGSQP